jgi:hypothetical protein
MGLDKGDLEAVPVGLSLEETYCRVYDWHTHNGLTRLRERYGREDDCARKYRELLAKLPEPGKASRADMAAIFRHVISNLMEWAYHEKDAHGIKIAAYAHHATREYFAGLEGLDKESKGSVLGI